MRVPVWAGGDPTEYTVCLGNEQYRHYSDDTVPGLIKSLLSMIRAFPEEVRRVPTHWLSPPIDVPNMYACPDKRLEEIGWQVRDDLYILIMDRTTLEDMYIRG